MDQHRYNKSQLERKRASIHGTNTIEATKQTNSPQRLPQSFRSYINKEPQCASGHSKYQQSTSSNDSTSLSGHRSLRQLLSPFHLVTRRIDGVAVLLVAQNPIYISTPCAISVEKRTPQYILIPKKVFPNLKLY